MWGKEGLSSGRDPYALLDDAAGDSVPPSLDPPSE